MSGNQGPTQILGQGGSQARGETQGGDGEGTGKGNEKTTDPAAFHLASISGALELRRTDLDRPPLSDVHLLAQLLNGAVTIMVNRAGDKGRLAENGLVAYLQAHGFPHAERRRLTGTKDKGDVAGTPGLCWEAKYAGTGPKWWTWMKETLIEQVHAQADYGILVVKPTGVGVTRIHLWYAAMSWTSWVKLSASTASTVGVWVMAGPRLFRPDFQQQLWLLDFSARQAGHAGGAIRLYKPGNEPNLHTHIVVTQLDQMVAMIRHAGYGDPIEGGP